MHLKTISIAPMMAYTDRHFRRLARLISPTIGLYTEMVTATEVLHNPVSKKLSTHPLAAPVVLQLGGCDPKLLAEAAKIGVEKGYVEINLNVGCPSHRVQSGRMGACLMKEPKLVSECIAAMRQAVTVPITLKTRIGVDNQDSYDYFFQFIRRVAEEGGCKTFIIHARKAWLTGLNPKENRTIPPLQYEYVYRLKQDFPHLEIIINGGIKTAREVGLHLNHVDGVMLGREAYANPWLIAELGQINGDKEKIVLQQILSSYGDYMEQELERNPNEKISFMIRHLQGLFRRKPQAKCFRSKLAGCRNIKDYRVLIQSDQLTSLELQQSRRCEIGV